ncbi:MAG: SH3 domain-containing protein, partial [Myxococcota bacterium]
LLATPALAQERPTLGPRADDGEAVGTWIAERVTRARQGHRDLVRLPLVFQSDGWGCICPTNFVGVDPDGHEGGETWLKVDNQSGDPFPSIPTQRRPDGEGGHYDYSEGMVVRVDGYFSGDVDVEVTTYGERYNVSVFVVTRIDRRMRRPDRARVALLGSTDVAVCERVVHDDSPLNVRERPRGRARVVGTLPNGTRVRPVRWRGHRWIRIDAPIAGWVWIDNTQRACGPTPGAAPESPPSSP